MHYIMSDSDIISDIIYDITSPKTHLPNGSFLYASVKVPKLCTRLLDISTDICCTPDRSLCVMSSSSFGHSQVGHAIVELSAVAAISNPSPC